MKRIKRCIMVILSLAFVVTGICLFGNPTKEVQAETQYNTDMLSLKFQRGQGSISNKIRVVASVDSPNYSAVGFDIAKGDADATRFTINTKEYPLPRRIQSSVEGMEYAFSPKVVDTSSEYFLTGKWDATAGVKYTVRAWAKAVDGTMIYGQSRCITLEDLDSAVQHLNMSFELKDGCTLSKSEEDDTKYAAINVTYNGKNTTAEVISVKDSTVHVNVNVDRTTLPSATKFVFKNNDNTECGSTIFRNLYTSYSETTEGETTTNTADTSWYDVYLEEGKDEFVIATNADLYGFSKLTSLSGDNKMPLTGKTIYLCADIEANKGQVNGSEWTGETSYPLTPIATGTPFNGIFDGQGHTISGVYVDPNNSNHGTGLFRWTEDQSVIRNFTLSNSLILGSNYYNGSIVGRAGGKISDVKSEAIVVGRNPYTGGIAGYLHSDLSDIVIQIENCTFSGSVTGGNFTGGIAGGFGKTDIKVTNCKVTDQVSGSQATGGILGGKDYSLSEAKTYDIENCQFSGEIKAATDYVGGIIGITHAGNTSINNCRFNGKVATSTASVGGIVGNAYAGITYIQKCTSSDSATVKNTSSNYAHYAGGIVGTIKGDVTISNSSYTGKFEAQQKIGGIAGYISGSATIEDSYFDGEFTATKGYSGGLVGYIVSSGTINLSNCYATGNVNLTGGSNVGGIIGCLESGTINIEDSYFDGTLSSQGEYAGGLVGNMSGGTLDIDNSYTDGTLSTAQHYAGGLIASVTSGTVDISASYSSMDFDQAVSNQKGGLIGYVYGSMKISLTDCLNSGTVKGASGIGGLVGGCYIDTANGGSFTMTRCLNKGDVIGAADTNKKGSLIGWPWSLPTTDSVYAVLTDNATVVSGNDQTVSATTCSLTDITVGNGVDADAVKSTLSGLFGADNTIWTIGTEVGSTPELKFN